MMMVVVEVSFVFKSLFSTQYEVVSMAVATWVSPVSELLLHLYC